MASLLLSLGNLLSEQILLWWISFFLVNLIFMFLVQRELVNFVGFITYFYTQELQGFLFLFSLSKMISTLIMFFKSGVGLFFFWMLPLVKNLSGKSLFNFVISLKMIYLPLFFKCFSNTLVLFLGGSLMLISVFHLFLKSLKSIFFLNSGESLTVALVSLNYTIVDAIVVLLIYFSTVGVMSERTEQFSEVEKSFFFLGLPLNPVFFIKLTFFSTVGESLFWTLLLMFFNSFSLVSSLIFVMKTFEMQKQKSINMWSLILLSLLMVSL